jgi:alcohol dehydrogenase class IV
MSHDQFTFFTNSRVVFGAGSASCLTEWFSEGREGEAVIITGRSLADSDFLNSRTDELKKAGIPYRHFTIHGEPDIDTVDRITVELKGAAVSRIAAAGGGSVIDTGKAVSAMILEDGSVADFLEGVGTKKPSGRKVPFLAAPTTAGTGAEATKNAVICRRGPDGFKKSLRHDAFVPDIAVIDPRLSAGCPPDVTAASGMDAFSQLVEAFLSLDSSPLTDALALSGIERFFDSFLTVCQDEPDNISLRGDLAYGAWLSGAVLANAGLGTVHGLAGPMGGFFDIPHGTACANLLPGVLKITAYRLMEEEKTSPALIKMARLGRLAAGREDLGDEEAVDFLLYLADEWLEILRIPRLGAFGITEEDLPRIADSGGNKKNPLPLTKDEMLQVMAFRI